MKSQKHSKLGIFSLICSILTIIAFGTSSIIRATHPGSSIGKPLLAVVIGVLLAAVLFVLIIAVLMPFFRRTDQKVSELRSQNILAFICAGEGGFPSSLIMTRDETTLFFYKLHKNQLKVYRSYLLDTISPVINQVEGYKGFMHDGINLQNDPIKPDKYFVLPYPAKVLSRYLKADELVDVIDKIKPVQTNSI